MQLYQLSFPNGKKYIGITSNTAQARFKQHCKASANKNPCQNAIHKYGKENVVVTVIAECDSWELLCLAEMEAIEKYGTFGKKGYNMTLGGEGKQTVGIYGDERIKRDRILAFKQKKHYCEVNKNKISEKSKIHRKNNKDIYSRKDKIRYEENKPRISKQKKYIMLRIKTKYLALEVSIIKKTRKN